MNNYFEHKYMDSRTKFIKYTFADNYSADSGGWVKDTKQESAMNEFDLWLNSVKAMAWDEGYNSNSGLIEEPNPYRK